MRNHFLLAALLIAATAAAAAPAVQTPAPQTPPATTAAASAGGLITLTHQRTDGVAVITVIDSEKRWMAVYHLPDDGTIRLVSSRPIGPDLTLTLNATEPTPQRIGRMTSAR